MKPFAFLTRKRNVSLDCLHTLMESAIDGIITMDCKGRIIAFNPAAEKIFGYSCDEVIGHTVAEKLIPRSLRKAHEKGLDHFLATGKKVIIGQRVEVTAKRADQSLFTAELEVIADNSKTTPLFFAYLRDISGQKHAARESQQRTIEIKKALMQTILAISRIVEIRDPYTADHQRRVAHLAATIAESLKFSEERIDGVFLGALIHDIGKIAVPTEILARPGILLDEDIRYLQIHCQKGYEILEPVNFPWPLAEIALQHHEHVDGSGYPQGLRKGEILLESRIVGVADVVESLTAHRPYRPAYSLEEALELISKRAGKWYDRQVVTICKELFKSGYSIDTIDMDELTWRSSLE